MIINPCKKVHRDHTNQYVTKLQLEIVCTVIIQVCRCIGTGTIEHYQSKAQQKYQNKQQVVIKICSCFLSGDNNTASPDFALS